MRPHPARLAILPVLLSLFLASLVAARAVSVGELRIVLAAGPFTQPNEISCTPWRSVTEGGLGLPSSADPADLTPFAGEDAFETTVFNGRIYVGMEADNPLGARLWRTVAAGVPPQAQSDWEEVIADADGRPWGIQPATQVDHIDSLAEFHGELFASTANTGEPTGTRIFRSETGDPGSWEDALAGVGPGFGSPANENFKAMVVFKDRLCGGTWNEAGGAETWCTSDGSSWERKNEPGFGDPLNAVNWSSAVFRDHLYFGVQRQASAGGFSRLDAARIYRTGSLDGAPDWQLVFDGGPRTGPAMLLGEAGGKLFAATISPSGIRVWSSETGDAGSWQPSGRGGISGNRANFTTNTDGAVLYHGRLHLAVSNPLNGFRVWRLDPDGLWRIVGPMDSYERNDVSAQLVVLGDSLYAWTTNFHSGQTVRQTSCADTAPDSAPAARLAAATGLLLAVVFAEAVFRRRAEQAGT